MVRCLRLFLICLMILGFTSVSRAQLDRDIVSAREDWEAFLKRAKIVKSEDLGEGITRPKRLYLERGGIHAMAVWKHPMGIGAEKNDRWQWEIAAYRLDKFLGLDMVPPTVERRFKGRKGSCQLWVNFEISEGERLEKNIQIPEDRQEDYIKAVSLQRAFDSLIANTDRNQQNLRYTAGWRIVLIDHSRSFRSNRIYGRRLLYGRKGVRKERPILKVPRKFLERLKRMTAKNVRSAVEFTMTFSEIKDMLVRRDILVREIEDLITENGEDQVLY